MSDMLRYDQLSETLLRLGYPQDAAEYHGALCGALCVKNVDDIDPMHLVESTGSPASGSAEAARDLRRLCAQALDSLSSAEMSFTPLLPDDAQDLSMRVRALSSWCEGFLYGLATRPGLNISRFSDAAQEIIRDFTEFTRATVYGEDEQEIEENAYAELVEYIRVGAQLVYMELNEREARDEAGQTTLH